MTKDELLKSRDLLLRKKPFLRGSSSFSVNDPTDGLDASPTQSFKAQIPNIGKVVVSQERFARSLTQTATL